MNAIYDIIPNYSRRKVDVKLKEDVRQWKYQAKGYIPPWLGQTEHGERFMYIVMAFQGNWLTKVGKPRVIDLSNLEKVVIDTIAEKLGFNDCMIYKKLTTKVQNIEQFGVNVEVGFL